ncbi:MAG: hypothetical protein V8T86_11370 [Victivallis sp.]
MPGIFWYWNADPPTNGIRRQLTQIGAAVFRSVYLHPMPDNFRKSDFKSGMKMRYLGRKFFAWPGRPSTSAAASGSAS